MTRTDITQTTITDMNSRVSNYSVASQQLDKAQNLNELYWDNNNYDQWNAYYKMIPEYKTAINAFATWVVGKGYTSDSRTTAILDNMDGWGEDTFLSIIWNMIVQKKVHGDAFAEILRAEDGRIVNIKPIDTLRIVTNKQGRIIRYEKIDDLGDQPKKFKPHEILHLCNNRVANEIHGTSITESVEWVILARNEAMDDKRRQLHRSTIRVIEVDEDDTTRLTNLKKDWADAINDGEVMLVPKGTGAIQDLVPPQTEHLEWIRYLENFFYQALGVPKVILGGSEEFTEASSKIGYLTFEQIYEKEVAELKADLWNQLAIRLEINKPASINNELLQSGDKNKAQTGFQPNDTQAGVGK